MENLKRALRWLLLPVGIYLLGVLMFFVLAAAIGVPIGGKQMQIAAVMKDGAAEAAGLQASDVLLTVDGTTVDFDHPAREVIARAGGKPVRVRVERAGGTQEFTVEPRNGVIGVQLRPNETCGRLPVGEAAKIGFGRPAEMAWMLFDRPKGVDVIGPLGISMQTSISPCVKRLGYVMWGSTILVLLAVVSLPISVVLAVRAVRRARRASRVAAA